MQEVKSIVYPFGDLQLSSVLSCHDIYAILELLVSLNTFNDQFQSFHEGIQINTLKIFSQ